jgi:acyl-coenzyme A synthetase/AMP-(fatty) acid ligase
MGGINTVLHALSNGGMVAFPDGRSVGEICALVRAHRIQLLPATPSFLNLLLLSRATATEALSSVELITYGTEMMPERTLARLTKMFPGVTLQQTYGLSELGVLRSKSLASDSLFVKVGGEGFECRAVDGTLWIRADSAMEGYLNSPDPFHEDGWYDTGDKVEMQGDYIRFLGRESDVINVKDATVSGEPNALLGNAVVTHIVLDRDEPPDEAVRRVKAACRQSLRRFMVPLKIHIVQELPCSDRFKKVRASAPRHAVEAQPKSTE